MKVLKFGGTSVGSVDAIRQVRKLVESESQSHQLIVVVSAFSGVTNKLEEIIELSKNNYDLAQLSVKELENQHIKVYNELTGNQGNDFIKEQFKNLKDVSNGINLIQEITKKSSDFIVTLGEVLSAHIIAKYFQETLDVNLYNSKDFLITSNKTYLGKIDLIESQSRFDQIKDFARVNLFPGFIATNPKGQTTSLGRGGSDYTASILSNLANANELQIWTDVSGILSADPKLVKQSRVLPHLSYEEALELSHFGAKVIYPPSIQPALIKGIPISIKNTFKPEEKGTLVTKEWDNSKAIIQGISSIKKAVLINMSGAGMVGIPSFSYRFFKSLADNNINIILISQASSEHSICVAITESEADPALKGIREEFEDEFKNGMLSEIVVEKDLAIIALVGSNMRAQVGVSGKMFYSLGKNGINIKAIAQGSSERNISAIIPSKDLKKALNVLHESFFLSDKKRINLFVVGVGNVGKAFIEQIQKQQSFIERMQELSIRIVALANSKKMVIDSNGIELSNWKDLLNQGIPYQPQDLIQHIEELNLRNSVFIDITASNKISDLYAELLEKNVSVVTPNKLGATTAYQNFKNLHDISVRNGVQFLYETNVAAGLPVISTLKDLIKSGDKIHKIEAVLSGTLNYLFNTYDTSVKFVDVVKEAREKGLTEPDPREDLLGEDVKRKILILARETGLKLEMKDVVFDSFLPSAALETDSIDKFYQILDEHENHFTSLYQKANASNNKLRVVASLENKIPKVSLKSISSDHSFYHLEGKDNIVLFYSNRYFDQPLTIKGAGAGAEVTASGIFADVLKISAN